MRVHRGLALMLLVFGTLFGVLGRFFAIGHGPATSAFEAVRRYDAAARGGDSALATRLGERALRLAANDDRWNAAQLADLEYRLALSAQAAGDNSSALKLARSASLRLDKTPDADLTLLIDVAHTRADIALDTGGKIEAACVYGLLLERLGPDRVTHPEQRERPHPELQWLTDHLDSVGAKFAAIPAAELSKDQSWPLTSCNLLASFYVGRKNYAAAAGVSRIVLAGARKDEGLGPEMRAALLQSGARNSELAGDIETAASELEEAVSVLEPAKDEGALVVALETLASFKVNWGDSAGALPILERVIAMREKLGGKSAPALAAPLISLGYAEMDSGNHRAAQAAFDRALTIARGAPARDASNELEALMALAELYDDQGRNAQATATRAKVEALQKKGVLLSPSRYLPQPTRPANSKSRIAVFDIPFRASGRPAGGRASEAFGPPPATPAFGRVEVALAAPSRAGWTRAWSSQTFEQASDALVQPRVYAPDVATPAEPDPLTSADLIFLPGQGTSFAGNAGRLAALQALLGPDEHPALIHWATDESARSLLRDKAAERAGAHQLVVALEEIMAAKDKHTFGLIAEGRGAALAANAFKTLAPAARTKIAARLKHLILIAPDLSDQELKHWLSGLDRKRTHILVYSAPGARALAATSEVYHEDPIGRDNVKLAAIKGIETVEITAPAPSADFTTLTSPALLADIAAVAHGAPPADKRCGILRKTDGGFALAPRGCPASNTM